LTTDQPKGQSGLISMAEEEGKGTVVSASSVNNFKNRLDGCAEWGI